jgi:hypothetical protein
MHFAASSLVGESVSDPHKYYHNNVEGTLSLLRAMRQTQCETLIFSSSGAVYGESHQGLISETEIPRPANPYGRTKLIIEEMLTDFQKAYALAPVCLRYFNASGADLSGEIGEDHDPETHLIPRALLAAQGKVEDFAIYGDDYDTPDGTAIRDYIHVVDLAQAHVLALKYLVSGWSGRLLQFGHGPRVFRKANPPPNWCLQWEGNSVCRQAAASGRSAGSRCRSGTRQSNSRFCAAIFGPLDNRWLGVEMASTRSPRRSARGKADHPLATLAVFDMRPRLQKLKRRT